MGAEILSRPPTVALRASHDEAYDAPASARRKAVGTDILMATGRRRSSVLEMKESSEEPETCQAAYLI